MFSHNCIRFHFNYNFLGSSRVTHRPLFQRSSVGSSYTRAHGPSIISSQQAGSPCGAISARSFISASANVRNDPDLAANVVY
jgi:hypothetical protein